MRTRGSQNRKTPARRQAILDAALAEFTERGFERATLNRICARLELSKGSIYHHFADKEEIAVALYSGAIDDIHAAVAAGRVKTPAPRAGIEGFVRAYLRWFERNPARGRLMFEIRDGRIADVQVDHVLASQRAFIDATATWLTDYARRGSVRRMPTGLYVALVLGPCRDFLRRWFLRQDPADMRTAQRLLPLAAWRAIAAPSR
jgi:AcrR family transcriptional regulator